MQLSKSFWKYNPALLTNRRDNYIQLTLSIFFFSPIFIVKCIGVNLVASLSLLSKIPEAGCTCVVGHSGNNNKVAPIIKTFQDCNNGGTVVFPAGQAYNVKSALELQGLKKIVKGKGYMYFNGDNIHFSGRGIINRNGQGWFDAQNNQGPTIIRVNVRNSYFAGFTVKHAPNDHFSIVGSQNNILVSVFFHIVPTYTNIPAKYTYVFGIYNSGNFIARSSTIVNGDDCFSVHSDLSNITVFELSCASGYGFSIGSLGNDAIS
ncbi:glycoside hydrolase family 28 protein [Phycomyces blakesleeanus]